MRDNLAVVHVKTRSLEEDLRATVDAGVELANVLSGAGGTKEVRNVLVAHEFVRAPGATDEAIAEVARRFGPVAAIIRSLPEVDLARAVGSVNEELAACQVAPSLIAHDGAPLHIHWTRPDASFGLQVVVDVLMALAQVLCEDGTARFGTCRAEGCERLFYDTTKNRSRAFCSDPRCASRTHTAAHRSRVRER